MQRAASMRDPIRARARGANIPPVERVATTALAAAAIVHGIRRRTPLGWLIAAGGGLVALRGLSGRSAIYRRLAHADGVEVRRAITIQRSRSDVYRFWRQLDNLPRFLEHVQEVRLLGPETSRWVVREGPATVSWIAEVSDELSDRRLAWRSRPGSAIETSGELELLDAPGGRGTEVHVTLRYRPPASVLTGPVRGLLRRLTYHQLGAELRRLRQLLETGELATAAPRPAEVAGKELAAAALGRAAPPLPPPRRMPDEPVPTQPPLGEV
jgi:uncharacterized membrane protein